MKTVLLPTGLATRYNEAFNCRNHSCLGFTYALRYQYPPISKTMDVTQVHMLMWLPLDIGLLAPDVPEFDLKIRQKIDHWLYEMRGQTVMEEFYDPGRIAIKARFKEMNDRLKGRVLWREL